MTYRQWGLIYEFLERCFRQISDKGSRKRVWSNRNTQRLYQIWSSRDLQQWYVRRLFLMACLVQVSWTRSVWSWADYSFSVLTKLGLVNEVQRPDRNEYIEVNSFAISDNFKPLFQKHSDWSPVNEGYPFDIHSVMMFDSYDFTKDWFNISATVQSTSNPIRQDVLTQWRTSTEGILFF